MKGGVSLFIYSNQTLSLFYVGYEEKKLHIKNILSGVWLIPSIVRVS